MNKRLVLVEDDNIISSSQSRFLKEKGFDVSVFSSGEAFLEYASGDGKIDLVLMDIDLGDGINGIEAAEIFISERSVPVVYLTSYADEKTIERINSAGAYGYVLKNSGEAVLLSAITMAFRMHKTVMELHKSEEKYRFIAENSTDVISQLDTHGRIVYMTPLGSQLTGYSEDELIGADNIEFYHEEDRPSLIEIFKKIRSTDDIVTFNYRFRRSDGSYRWIETCSKRMLSADGNFSGVISSSRDITERVETDRALRESEEKLHLIMNGIPALISYIGSDGRYAYINDEYERWFGVRKEEILGRKLDELLTSEMYDAIKDNYLKAFAGESVEKEYPITYITGVEKFVRVNYVPNISNGEVKGIFVMVFDITEIKKAEEKILTLLNEKDLLLKEVHHRVKNNMGSIAALLYLQMDAIENPDAVNALQDARSRVISMMGIYNILYKTGEYKSVDAREYFNDLIGKISSTYITSPKIRMESDIDDISLDSGILFPLGMIVNELLTNSVKYAFSGGMGGVIKVSIKISANEKVEVIIGDNGIGLPDAMEISGAGGFGLTLVKMMVQQINGSVKINRLGGTEFRISFPVLDRVV